MPSRVLFVWFYQENVAASDIRRSNHDHRLFNSEIYSGAYQKIVALIPIIGGRYFDILVEKISIARCKHIVRTFGLLFAHLQK